MTDAPSLPAPAAHGAEAPATALAGLLGAWLSHQFLATHVLWRTRPGLQPIAQMLGVVLALMAGLAIGATLWRCRRLLGSTLDGDEPEGRWAASPRRHPLAWSSACVILAYALTLTLHPALLDIDDAYWWMFSAGFGMSSTPDEHLWCSHHLLGRVLAALYRFSPGGPWYGLYLVSVAAVSHVALGYLLARRLGRRGLLLFGLQFCVLDLYFAHRLQFTVEAILPGIAGVLLLAHSLHRQEPRPWRHFCAGSALVGLASAVRVDASFLALGVFSPVVLLEAWPLDRQRAYRLAAMALVILLVLGAAIEDRMYYRSDPEWRDFRRKYMGLRQKLVEEVQRPDIEYLAAKPVFDEVGWCESDLHLIRAAVYYDDERISDERVGRILDRLPRPWQLDLTEYAAQARDQATHPRVMLALPFVILVLCGLPRRGFVALGLCVVMWCAAVVYFLNFAKPPPERVYLPILAGLLPACALFPGLPCPRLRSTRLVLLPVVIALGVHNVADTAQAGRIVRRRADELRSAIERLAPRPDQLYVIAGAGFPYQDLLPLRDIEFMRPMKILGTYHDCAFNKRRMREFGISDVYTALYERDDVLLISTAEVNRWLKASIQFHRGIELAFEPVFEGPEFTVYDVKRTRSAR